MDEEMDSKVNLCSGTKIKSERTIFDFSNCKFEQIQVDFEDDPANEDVFYAYEDCKNFIKSTNKSISPHFIVGSKTSPSSNQTGVSSLQAVIRKMKKIELNDYDPLTTEAGTWLSLFESKMIEIDTLHQSLTIVCKYLDLSGLEFYHQTIR